MYTLRVSLFGEILGRMENLREKSGERSFRGCLVGMKSRKKMWWDLNVFSPRPIKKFSPQNGEKTRGRSTLTEATQNVMRILLC